MTHSSTQGSTGQDLQQYTSAFWFGCELRWAPLWVLIRGGYPLVLIYDTRSRLWRLIIINIMVLTNTDTSMQKLAVSMKRITGWIREAPLGWVEVLVRFVVLLICCPEAAAVPVVFRAIELVEHGHTKVRYHGVRNVDRC